MVVQEAKGTVEARSASADAVLRPGLTWLVGVWGGVSSCFTGFVPAQEAANWYSLEDAFAHLASPRFMKTQQVFLRADTGEGSRPATSADDVAYALAHGASLQVRHLEGILPRTHPVCRLTSQIESELSQAVDSVSLFVTPAKSQALPAHSDSSDVIALQLSGRKSWIVSGSEFVLGPGDAAYIAAGDKHEVRHLEDDVSVSLAFVIEEIRLADLLHARLAEVLEAEAKTQGIPPIRNFDGGRVPPSLQAQISRVCNSLAQPEAIASIVDRHTRGRMLPPWGPTSQMRTLIKDTDAE